MRPATLPGGAWEALFPRALALVDDIERYGGLRDPFWTFGGGTVLMFRYGHRLAGRSLAEHLALYSQLPHQVGLAGQLAFALFPWIQARRWQMPPG